MYTNKTGSNLNFELYKGGKKFRKTQIKKTQLKKTQKVRQRGSGDSWFKPSTPEPIKRASKQCESTCESDAKVLCSRTCSSATRSAISEKYGIKNEFFDELQKQITRLREENYQLRVENKKVKESSPMNTIVLRSQ